jgi:hypothetical protein
MPKPKIIRIIMDSDLSESAGIPSCLTIVERNSVKKVKLAINPITTPSGLCLPVASLEDRIIGKRGRIHGDNTVTTPAKNANIVSKNI